MLPPPPPLLWRQMKRARTWGNQLAKCGLKEVRAWVSAANGRGPWWNAGASHMNEAHTLCPTLTNLD